MSNKNRFQPWAFFVDLMKAISSYLCHGTLNLYHWDSYPIVVARKGKIKIGLSYIINGKVIKHCFCRGSAVTVTFIGQP